MKLLLDSHILLWAALSPGRLTETARDLISDTRNELTFSVASIWEIAIKSALGRADFPVDPAILRRELLSNGYEELPVVGAHAIAVAGLPLVHKDPFDRILVAQAVVEGITLITADARIAEYPGPIRKM